jgi:tetratricopeptide (TPR) repeat protein
MRFFGGLVIAALLVVGVIAPFLRDQVGAVHARGGGNPFIAAPYRVFGEQFPVWVRRALDVPGYWLVILPVELPAAFIAGFIGLAAALRGAMPRDQKLAIKILACLAGAGLVISWLLVSTLGVLCLEWEIEPTQTVLQHAEELAALELFMAPHGQYFRDWCLSELGQVQEGTAPLTEALSDFRAKGLLRSVPFYLMLLAEVLEHKKHRSTALERLDEALHLLETTQERWCEAELYRRKGELLGLEGSLEAAEKFLGKALTIARQQSAKIWELRASISLARLWRDQGKCIAARDLLGAAYHWFTEGFEMPPLRDAQALLEELNEPVATNRAPD